MSKASHFFSWSSNANRP